MRLVTFDAGSGPRLGVVQHNRVVDLLKLAGMRGLTGEALAPFESTRAFLTGGDAAIESARSLLDRAGGDATGPALSDVTLRAPITDPRKILALAGNYREHIREGGGTVIPKEQQVPNVFIMPVTTIVGPHDPIRLPGPICPSVDYEGELGVVIGRAGKNIPVERALDYVAGYLVVNDVSGRTLNVEVEREMTPRTAFFDWLAGKWFDTFAPMGPALVLKDEVPDPQALKLETRVNGQVRQSASTADMIFTAAETVAWISRFVTLEPGDVIATGTPSGVGSTTKTFLREGDVVEVEIERLGTLRNPVAGPATP